MALDEKDLQEGVQDSTGPEMDVVEKDEPNHTDKLGAHVSTLGELIEKLSGILGSSASAAVDPSGEVVSDSSPLEMAPPWTHRNIGGR